MDKKMIVIKIMGFDSESDCKSYIIAIPSERFTQLNNNDLFYDFISKKVMGIVSDEAKRLRSKNDFLSIEEVLDKLGYNDCPFEEDKICIDAKKLKEFVDKK